MTKLATGAVKFIVRDRLSPTTPIVGAKIYTSINRITWHYRGYTSSTGSLTVQNLPAGINYYLISKDEYRVVSGSVMVAGALREIYIYMTRSP